MNSSRSRFAVLAFAAALVSAAFVTSANAQDVDSALEARTSAVAGQLRCPVCQGVSIQDSPSQLAQEMRGVVKDQLRSGRTPDQVKAYFVSKYGEWILLEPKATGMNVLVYALPVFLVLGGIAAIVLVVRRWTRNPVTPA